MAAGGHLESARTTLEVLRQRHEIVAGDLVEGPEAIRLLDEFANEFKALDKMLVAIASEKALSPPSQDSLLGAGESLSSKLVCAALQFAGVNSALVDARECIVTDARRVPRMSFDEAADLAYFGAKILHPATLLPAMRSNIPVWVLNSRNPDCPGTEIVAHCEPADGVKAITAKRGVAVVDVEPVRWFAPELLREVFDVFERHQHSLDLISASRGSLALLVSSVSALAAIAEELKGMANVRWENHKALVCLVGEQVRRRPEIASQAFRAVGAVDVRMICQGASERNISFLVDESHAAEAVQRLHRSFFAKSQPAIDLDDSLAMCQAEVVWYGAD
jgi:aspartate kinase